MFYIMLPILAILIAVYCRFYIMRACRTFGLGQGRYRIAVVIVVAVVSGGIATLCMFVMPVALFMAHVMAFSLIVRAVNLLIKSISGKKYKRGFGTWKTIYGFGILPIILATSVLLGGYVNMNTVTATNVTVYTQTAIRHAWDDRTFTEKELVQTIKSSGITLLSDETFSINDEFTVVGREDAAYEGENVRTPIAELVKDVDPTDFILALDHQPRQYKENAAAGVDLLLSGHTHGGQIFPAD
ncbi:MAG: hypothetical protein OSJ83_13810, partial [Clostridia bacterium]|nr:hypothetical protein [Clostridia bacterium]